jgi:Reverse transcriptase (RNA-dependent DNA polymerase)
VDDSRDHHVLKLLKNIYGQKQAGRVWNEFLLQGLKEIGFQQSSYDMCLLWRDACIIVIYTDDTIVAGQDKGTVEKVIKEIGSKFTITSSDVVADFLGVNITFSQDRRKITFSQPQLIRSIINELGLKEGSKTHRTPALSNVVLHAHERSLDHFEPWFIKRSASMCTILRTSKN